MDFDTAVQIVKKVDGKLVPDVEKLTKILQNVLKKKIKVVSITGPFRTGKSYFLSLCLLFLKSMQFLKRKQDDNWMDSSARVTGFKWRQSTKAVTDGIYMWPEPFIMEDKNGEEVAILLMDTEGAFDHNTPFGQCATVFSLSALLSSLLVYNVMGDVREDTLNHLQFFASYGTYAKRNTKDEKAFQSLLFLVRDWQNGNEFGIDAGRRLWREKMENSDDSDDSMRALRKDIVNSFDTVDCCLLPRPGDIICTASEGSNITINDMSVGFREELSKLIPKMFNSMATLKKIGGKEITGAEFINFFDSYGKLFASGTVPEPRNIFDVTAEATHQTALNDGFDLYNNTMKTHFELLDHRPYFEDGELIEIHQNASDAASKLFLDSKKMGDLPRYHGMLMQKINAQFKDVFLKDNQNKIKIERERKEKEAAEKRLIEQENEAKEEKEKLEKEKEALRVEAKEEKKKAEEAEKKLEEEGNQHKEEMEKMKESFEREKEEDRKRMEKEKRKRDEAAKKEDKPQQSNNPLGDLLTGILIPVIVLGNILTGNPPTRGLPGDIPPEPRPRGFPDIILN